MFTKMIFPIANFYFLESRPAPVLGNISLNGIMRANDRPWVALSLVLCAHLAVFAALRPQPQPLSVEPIPEPIMVSLLSAPQAAPQKPTSPATSIEKSKKPVKKQVKTSASKLVVPAIKQASKQASHSGCGAGIHARSPDDKLACCGARAHGNKQQDR